MTMNKTSFLLRIQEDDRAHDGTLMREQMLDMTKLRDLAGKTTVEDALAVLDKVPGAPVLPTDVY
jgi:hypothetical protein